jgi:hypothetical protein
MRSTRAHKRAAIDVTNPYDQEGTLELVMSFVGGAQALFVKPVNKQWEKAYEKMIAQLPVDRSQHAHTSRCTSYREAVASPMRLKLAHCFGLPIAAKQTDWDLLHCAGQHGDVQTLKMAFLLGMPKSARVAHGAAKSGDLDKLIWLHSKQRCPLPVNITATAAGARSKSILQWLKRKGYKFDKETSYCAAEVPDNLEVLQYLYDEQCPRYDRICQGGAMSGMYSLYYNLIC